MTVAVVCLSVALAGILSLLAWLIYRGDSRGDQLIEERAAHSATRMNLERATFELDATKQKLAQETKRADAAEEAIVDVKPNADLAPNDDDARLVRAAIKAKAAEARRTSPVFAGAEPAVSEKAAASESKPASVLPGDGLLDPNEVLR